MTTITHDILDCLGFEVVRNLSWNFKDPEVDNCKDEALGLECNNWGILICRPPDTMSPDSANQANRLFGAIGRIQTDHVQESCYGIPLNADLDLQSHLSNFALACGLSIIEKAQLELGDTIVVAGANRLAHNILIAASRQGARTACVIPASQQEASRQLGLDEVADMLLEFDYKASYETDLDAFVASSRGRTVYIDAVGLPELVHTMISRLGRFGTLVLCCQEATRSLPVDICRDIHRMSARIIYWTRPEKLKDAIAFEEYYQRAINLFRSRY